MITRAEILSTLAESIQKATAGEVTEEITEEKSFEGDLGLDSLTMVEIAVLLEERVRVKVPDDALPGLVTVADAVDYIAERVPALS